MNKEIKTSNKTGVITFLDVLGWKGIYGRQSDPITRLKLLIRMIDTEKNNLRGKRNNIYYDIDNYNVDVKSISDTIVLFSHCEEKEAPIVINLHALLCQLIIPKSIELEIPVRGAISFGEFETVDSIFVGKAVDEAAAWHEQADWIGVHLTPSAEYLFNGKKMGDLWIEFSIPMKASLKYKSQCVNWMTDWQDQNSEIKRIKSKFLQLGPILPEIAGKFANTLNFIEEGNKKRSSSLGDKS